MRIARRAPTIHSSWIRRYDTPPFPCRPVPLYESFVILIALSFFYPSIPNFPTCDLSPRRPLPTHCYIFLSFLSLLCFLLLFLPAPLQAIYADSSSKPSSFPFMCTPSIDTPSSLFPSPLFLPAPPSGHFVINRAFPLSTTNPHCSSFPPNIAHSTILLLPQTPPLGLPPPPIFQTLMLRLTP